jgi:hypothetical protein
LPVAASHTPFTHPAVRAEQFFSVPPAHCPPAHVLFTWHGSPVSEHATLSFAGSGVGSHAPVAGLHATALHSLKGEKKQSFGLPAHSPPEQTVLIWQRSSELHATPSAAGAKLQAWVSSSQLTSSHCGGSIPQSFCGPPRHWPSAQTSSVVQNWPSSQAAPSSLMTTQWPASPGYCPSLQTALRHWPVWICEQSYPHGPTSPPAPPAPPAPPWPFTPPSPPPPSPVVGVVSSVV